MRDLLLALFLLSAFPMILYRFQVGALVIAFISFMYPQSNTFGFVFTIQWIDLFFMVTLASYIMKKGYKSFQYHPLIYLLVIFYAWASITTMFSIDLDVSYEPWLKFSKIMLLAMVVYAMLGTEKRMITLTKVMVLSYAFYGIKGGLFTIISGGTSHVLGPINSFFPGNNEMAFVLVMTIPFMIYFYSHAENFYQRYFSLICAIFTAIAILGTQSRTGFVALGITLIYYTWLQKKLFMALKILVPVACIAYFFMPASWADRMSSTTDLETDVSFQGRVDMWRASVRIANDNPILGGGFNVIYEEGVIARYIPSGVNARAIHSSYFQMMAEHGYVGFGIFVFMLFYTYQTARRMARQSRNVEGLHWYPDLTIAIRSSLVGYAVLGLTANIAFFDLLYFIIIITALADNVLQSKIAPKESHPHVRVPAMA